MLLLEQDITRKEQIKGTQLEFEVGNSKEYKLETIKQRSLYKKIRKSVNKTLLSGFVEKLTWRKKYLGTIVISAILQKNNQLFLQKEPKQANNNLSFH